MATSQRQNKTDQPQKNTSPRQPQVQTNLKPGLTISPPELQRALGNPRAARPETILHLQRLAGNRATHHLIQSKLMVGPADDRYEQEADRVAQQVMAKDKGGSQPVQRQEEEEEVQTKPLAASITHLQRQEDEEEVQTKPIQRQEDEEEIQTKPSLQRSSEEGFEADREIERRLEANRGSGSPLPTETRAFMEPRFGADFSEVRVHTGGEAAQLSRAVQAQAFTHGNDIYFNEGKYDPQTETGKELLAHELTHTIQQSGAPQVQRNGDKKKQEEIKADAYTFETTHLRSKPRTEPEFNIGDNLPKNTPLRFLTDPHSNVGGPTGPRLDQNPKIKMGDKIKFHHVMILPKDGKPPSVPTGWIRGDKINVTEKEPSLLEQGMELAGVASELQGAQSDIKTIKAAPDELKGILNPIKADVSVDSTNVKPEPLATKVGMIQDIWKKITESTAYIVGQVMGIASAVTAFIKMETKRIRMNALKEKTKSLNKGILKIAEYGYQKLKRGWLFAVGDFIVKSVQTIVRIISMIIPNPVTAIIDLALEIFGAIVKLFVKAKGLAKWFVGKLGKHRAEAAKNLIKMAKDGNPEACELLVEMGPYGLVDRIKSWLLARFPSKKFEGEAQDITSFRELKELGSDKKAKAVGAWLKTHPGSEADLTDKLTESFRSIEL